MNAAVDDMESQGLLRRNEPLAKHTSWRVGGPADIYYEPSSVAALAAFVAAQPDDVPLTFIGLGSNLLVRDGGIRGVVICTSELPREIDRLDERRVRATAAVPCTSLARRCVRWQLGPAAFFAGIPGSLGGALAMNAGAFDGETWANVEQVETMDRRGGTHVCSRADFRVGYRSVVGAPEQWFVAVTFAFEHDPATQVSAIKSMVTKRAALQPLDRPSAGSVFRNPPGEFAGALIERAGLKGYRIGAAMVSEKHANFIVNLGGATARDIEGLIEHVRARVEENCGVALEPEVRIVGDEHGVRH
jgi:UDP-N-acetylmuramate dehydrogenase